MSDPEGKAPDVANPEAAITGWPVDHSRSPVIHTYWLQKYGLSGHYGRRAVPPEKAEAFYKGFAESGLVGCNVTVPNKEAAAKACDILDDAAQAMGAANTLWLEDGKLHGANTDGIGFLRNLDQQAIGWDRKPGSALVLGAGGAARAVIWGLLSRNIPTVHIFNRTLAKAEALSERFGIRVLAHPLDDLSKYLSEAMLLVNTTAAGMVGKADLEISLEGLPKEALVTDIVYTPLETGLLKAAALRGNATVDGLGMLLHQAGAGFEHWFGVLPEVDEDLRQTVLADLGIKSEAKA